MKTNRLLSATAWLLAVCIVGLAVYRLALAADKESYDDRRARIEKMSPAEKERIERNLERFGRLSVEEREELRALDRQLQADPDREALLATIDRYYAWVKSLTDVERAELQRLPPAERVERVVELQQQREQMFGWMLSRADERAVREWLLDEAPKHEEELLARSPLAMPFPVWRSGRRQPPGGRDQADDQAAPQEEAEADRPDPPTDDSDARLQQFRDRLNAMPEEERTRELANIAWLRWRWGAPDTAVEALRERLSPRAAERLKSAQGNERAMLLARWLSRVEAPAVTWDEIENYLKNEVGVEEQARLMTRQRSELMRMLTVPYLAHRWGMPFRSMDRMRGFPPFQGFGPGGPRGGPGEVGRRGRRDGQGALNRDR